MAKKLDCMGMACPMPVVETKKLLEGMAAGESVEVSVDNLIAVQNLSKMAVQNNLGFYSEKLTDSHYVVTITVSTSKAEPDADMDSCYPVRRPENVVVVLSSDKMGEGDEKLGKALMKGYIYALTEQNPLPQTVVMYNNGAKLAVPGSDSLADLKLLESQGVEVMTCGTCLNHYGLTEKLGVGTITNMYAIAEKFTDATKVIRPWHLRPQAFR